MTMNKTIINNVKKPVPAPIRIRWYWFVIIFVLFVEFLGHVVIRTETTQSMIRITRAQKELVKQQRYQKALNVEVDRLKSEDRIRRIAESKLELVRDPGTKVYYISGTKTNG